MHLIFKIATVLFALVWVVGVGLEVIQQWQLFGSTQVGGEVLLEPLSQPWATWFEEQTNMIAGPLITLTLLIIFTYLSKPNNR